MNTPIQEAVAQMIFWTGVGCFPVSVVFFIYAYQAREQWKARALCVLGGVAVTHFFWYGIYLGGALATKVGAFHPTPWWKFLPIGFISAAVLLRLRYSARRR